MAASFPDHFSGVSGSYARHRPTYPPALFAYLAGLCPRRECAWDCATGNGQAAVALAAHFAEVVATDASAEQITHAAPHPRVRYAVAAAEAVDLPDASVDLTTVATALHWFDRVHFFEEAARVLRPGGHLAVWTYTRLQTEPALSTILRAFYHDVIGPYWPFERRLVEGGYREVEFPFEPVEAPRFEAEAQWRLDDLVGYLGTWSGVQRYRAVVGEDPIPVVREALAAAWGDPEQPRPMRWPLALHVRRKPA